MLTCAPLKKIHENEVTKSPVLLSLQTNHYHSCLCCSFGGGSVYVCAYVFVCAHTCACMCICVCICICVCVCAQGLENLCQKSAFCLSQQISIFYSFLLRSQERQKRKFAQSSEKQILAICLLGYKKMKFLKITQDLMRPVGFFG